MKKHPSFTGLLLSLIFSSSLLFSQTPLWNRAWQSGSNTRLNTGVMMGSESLWVGGGYDNVFHGQLQSFYGPLPYLAALDTAGNLLWEKNLSPQSFPNFLWPLEEVSRIHRVPGGGCKVLMLGRIACDIVTYGMALASYDSMGNQIHHFTKSPNQLDDTTLNDFWLLPDGRLLFSGQGWTYPLGLRNFLYLTTPDGDLIRAMDLSQLESINNFHHQSADQWLVASDKGAAICDSLGQLHGVGLLGKKVVDFIPWPQGGYLVLSFNRAYRLNSQLVVRDTLALPGLGHVKAFRQHGQQIWAVGQFGVAQIDTSFQLLPPQAKNFSPHFVIGDLLLDGNNAYALGGFNRSAAILPFTPQQAPSYPDVDITLDSIERYNQTFTNPPYEYDLSFQIWVSNPGQLPIHSFDVQAFLGTGYCDVWGFKQRFTNVQLLPGQQQSFLLDPLAVKLYLFSFPSVSSFHLLNPNQRFETNRNDNRRSFISTSIAPDRELGLKLFPQPAQDLLRLEAEKPFRSLQLIDLQGRLIWEDHFAPSKAKEIKRGSWSNGIYLLEINAGSYTQIRKVIWQ